MSDHETDAWHDLVRDIHAEHEVVKAERDMLHQALRLVKACFDSQADATECTSDCINNHHPSCNEYITSVLAKVEKK